MAIGNIFARFSGMGTTIAYTLLTLVPIILVLVLVIVTLRGRSIYRYRVRIFRIREGGKVKEANFKGGYIGRKNSAPFFRIKTGKMPWHVIDLNTTPLPEYMDEEDRFYYVQRDVNTFIQIKRKMCLKKLGEAQYAPVESDVKYGAILAMHRIRNVLQTEPTWKKVLPYFGILFLGVIFIVAYAMLMDKCS